MTIDQPTPAEIADRARQWLANGGDAQLREAFAKAEANIRRLQEEAAVDWRLLDEPCTI